jgi:hypothetical protein
MKISVSHINICYFILLVAKTASWMNIKILRYMRRCQLKLSSIQSLPFLKIGVVDHFQAPPLYLGPYFDRGTCEPKTSNGSRSEVKMHIRKV